MHLYSAKWKRLFRLFACGQPSSSNLLGGVVEVGQHAGAGVKFLLVMHEGYTMKAAELLGAGTKTRGLKKQMALIGNVVWNENTSQCAVMHTVSISASAFNNPWVKTLMLTNNRQFINKTWFLSEVKKEHVRSRMKSELKGLHKTLGIKSWS